MGISKIVEAINVDEVVRKAELIIMFTKKVTVKIKKDKKYIEYIKIIRNYDNSLSMTQIKNAIDKGEAVFFFDPRNNPIIQNGKDNSECFLEEIFVKTLRQLKRAGATMVVAEGERELLEFSKVLSSKENIDQLFKQLYDADDGSSAYAIIDKVKKIASKNEEKRNFIIENLMKYSNETPMNHLKSLTVTDINKLVKENETQYADFFISKIESGDFSAAYYAIEGYTKVMQKMSYKYLVESLISSKLNIECNALIVCELSHLSNNPFDQGSPWEKRDWKKSDLKLEEIKRWKEAGYPDGNGYVNPIVHPCLSNPSSIDEKVYAKLDKKLSKKREKNTDKAHPTNWLVQADKDDIDRIQKELCVPSNYLDFLKKASPLNVEIKLKEYGPVTLIGAHELIEMQGGYSFNPIRNEKIKEWPESYIVIATCSSDPFCIDNTNSNSPIYYTTHDTDEWDFEEVFPSLLDFLKALG